MSKYTIQDILQSYPDYNIGDKVRIKYIGDNKRVQNQIDENEWATVIGQRDDAVYLKYPKSRPRFFSKTSIRQLDLQPTEEAQYDDDAVDVVRDRRSTNKQYVYPELPNLSNPKDYHNAVGNDNEIFGDIVCLTEFDILNQYINYYIIEVFAKANHFRVNLYQVDSVSLGNISKLHNLLYYELKYDRNLYTKYIPDVIAYKRYLLTIYEDRAVAYDNYKPSLEYCTELVDKQEQELQAKRYAQNI